MPQLGLFALLCLIVLLLQPIAGLPHPRRAFSSQPSLSLAPSPSPSPSPSLSPSPASTLPFRAVQAPSSIAAARAVIARSYPQHVRLFNLSIVAKPNTSSLDHFILSSSPSATSISITGTSAVMLTAGFNYYLSYFLNIQLLTWSSSTPPTLPSKLIPIPRPTTIAYPYLLRYYHNICTLSYSTQWWDFNQWEKEIDWMALRGVNFPLALNGQELVWYKVYTELGLNSTEILSFIPGPAFLAWQRMGNIQGWGGPMTLSWMVSQQRLQRQILTRMRSLDMYPILAAFDGYVPTAMKLHYPNATITPSAGWSTFPLQYQNDDLLDPSDPLFQTIGALYIKRQAEMYGSDLHFFNSDTYNENSPSTNNTDYLARVSSAVYSAMKQSDPAAVWVMQGNFWEPEQVKAYLDSVPNDRMIILDLMSDVSPVFSRQQNYYGKLFIWNMLHNFGGNLGMYGVIDTIATQPALSKQAVGDAMIGIGATPEGIFQNEIMYDLLFDMAWRDKPIASVSAWTRRYVQRRYGIPADAVGSFAPLFQAYELLLATVYNCSTGQWGVTKSFLELTPSLQMNSTGFMPTTIWYDNSVLERVVGLVLSVSRFSGRLDVTGRERYEYDVIDFTKQWMSNHLISDHATLIQAYHAHNLTALHTTGSLILSLISDIDSLLATNVHYLLGPWLHDARRWGATIAEEEWLEWNARNQITLWGPDGEIADYASKQWSGLVSGYYMPRWERFVESLGAAVEKGVEWDEAGYVTAKRGVEQQWQHSKEKYPTTPEGKTVPYAAYVWNKYRRAAVDVE